MPSHSKNKHPDHSAEISRLNRILGQIEGVKKMIAARRYCPDIITQLRAINSATKAVETSLLATHIEACVIETFTTKNKKDQQQKIEELTKLFKRFD